MSTGKIVTPHEERAVAASSIVDDILAIASAASRPPKLAYCDYIAQRIKEALSGVDRERIIADVGRVQWDLHPTEGWFVSTKKTIEITDIGGKRYRVTVEEVD